LTANNLTSHNETCPPGESLFEFLEPLQCTACPAHAYCTPDTVTCERLYVLRPHPLAELPVLPSIFNGLPGIGPVAFPPKCVEDEKRKQFLGKLGMVIESHLANVRGQRICNDLKGPLGVAGEAGVWGIELNHVHDTLKLRMTKYQRTVAPEKFDEMFDQAIEELLRYEFIFMDQDPNGVKYVATKRVNFDILCKIRVTARDTWEEWKRFVIATGFGIASLLILRQRLVEWRSESRRISELVQIALDTLQNQELAHHTDPVTTPHPYLPSIHLRDLVLQGTHSIPVRRRIWDKVEKVVEGNTNVKATMEELEGGDEGKVWRWVGRSHRGAVKA